MRGANLRLIRRRTYPHGHVFHSGRGLPAARAPRPFIWHKRLNKGITARALAATSEERMDYLAFGFSDGVGSRSSLSLQNGEQPIERRTSRLWINKLTGRVDDEPASLPARPSRLTPARSFPPVAVGLEDGRRTTQSPPRRLSTVVSDPSGGSGQALEGDLRDRVATCAEI